MCWVWEGREEQRNHRCLRLYPPESDEVFPPQTLLRTATPLLLLTTFSPSFKQTLYLQFLKFLNLRNGIAPLARLNERIYDREYEKREINYTSTCLLVLQLWLHTPKVAIEISDWCHMLPEYSFFYSNMLRAV